MAGPSAKEVREQARKLLRKAGVKEPPVPVEAVARFCGASVRYKAYTGAFSGLIAKSGDEWVIGVNSLDAPARQRFTIAHEIGHLTLHSQKEPHVDHADDFQVRFRGPSASAGIDEDEIAANRFASELLMPENLLLNDLADTPLHLVDADGLIGELAERYNVSRQAMTIRLINLGLGKLLGLD